VTTPCLLDLRGIPADDADLSPVVAHLESGGLLAYPTETVYGFGGLATETSVDAVRRLKRRTDSKSLLVLVPGADAVQDLQWTDEARELAKVFWPGSMTLVLSDPRGIFPGGIRSGEGSVAVRVSPHPLVGALLRSVDSLTSTSANEPGSPSALSGDEAYRAAIAVGAGSEMLVLDGGTLPPSGPSTIIDCTGPSPVVLREGTIPVGRLRCVLPEIHGI